MRVAGRISFIAFLLVLTAFNLTALADDTGQPAPAGSPGREVQTAEEYFDPDLESILAVNDRDQYRFLSRLTPAEQQALARMIKKRVDDEAGVVVSIMAIVSRFVPAILSAQFADKMEPATVARISDKVSARKAVAIAKHLQPEFLAEVAVYQDPTKVTAVVEGLPDDDLVEITRILFSRGEYRVVAKFSDGLSPEKLKNVAEKINDPATLVEIARHMENREKTVATAVSLSDDYLLSFMNLLSGADDYRLAAAVGHSLDVKRQINMLNRLDPEKAALLASYYPPETIAAIMATPPGVPDRQLVDITRNLIERKDFQVVAGFSDVLGVDKLKHAASIINDPAGLVQIARHMKDKGKVVETATGLSDDYLLKFMAVLSEGDDYSLAAAVGAALDVNRQVNLLDRLDPEKAARLASYYPPETIAAIMGKINDEKLIDIARRLSPEAMAQVAKALKAEDINRLVQRIDRGQLAAALPHMDLSIFKGMWPRLTSATKNTLKEIGRDYAPLAETIAAVER